MNAFETQSGQLSGCGFRRDFPSELYRVRQELLDAMLHIKTCLPELAKQDETDLRLILSEILFNAVIHGNKHDGSKLVVLEVCVDAAGQAVECAVLDEGTGFDFQSVIDGFTAAGDELYNEHGRGIRLVCQLSDIVVFNARGNGIKIRKKVSVHG